MAILVYRMLFAPKNIVHNKQLLNMVCAFFVVNLLYAAAAAASQLLELAAGRPLQSQKQFADIFSVKP